MKIYKTGITITLYLLSILSLAAQEGPRTSSFLSVGFNYGLDIPAADLADRYGQSFHAGLSLRLFGPKKKGFLAIETNAQFGSNVKEDVLAPYRLNSGAILGQGGFPAEVFLRKRGIYVGLYANKIIVSSKKNPLSGLAFGLGAGILQHNIRFLDERNNTTYINGDYVKGYDRSTRGPALKQTLTYEHIGLNRSLNYSLGFSITEGFTKSIRAVNFDTGLSDTASRLDVMISLEAIWYLPIRELGQSSGETFY